MSEKRFESVLDEETMSVMPYLVSDKEKEAFYNLEGCVDLLNQLSEENNQLKVENEVLKMENEEQKELMPKKLVVTITPTFYGWKSKVEEMGR